MRFAEYWEKLKQKKIEKKDLIIAILAFLVIALIFFGWFYFRDKRNPFTIPTADDQYRYLYAIYDPAHLKRPLGVAVSPYGDILVADSASHKIVVFDRNGQFKQKFGSQGKGAGQFNYPASVAVSGNKIFVADLYNQRVQVLDSSGNPLSIIPSPKDLKQVGSGVMPVAVATDSKGNLYVSDIGQQRILCFDSAGNFQRAFGRPGSNPGEISYVNGIAVDNRGAGRIYLSNSNNARVDEYTLDGKFVKMRTADRALANPKGIAFDQGNNRVYAADTFAHQVVGINTDGSFFENIGKRGFGPGEFNFPTAVALDNQGRLYVADRENNRIAVFSR